MGQEINTSHFSARDFANFAEHLREETTLLEHWFKEGRLDESTGIGGFELEAWLVDEAMRHVRQRKSR